VAIGLRAPTAAELEMQRERAEAALGELPEGVQLA
jgi:hypothetical protein